MKRALIALVMLLAVGCVAHITPQGTYIEPLYPSIVIGPPVVVAPPPSVTVSPLPPVVVVPGRHLYYYGNAYYYNWEGRWYWGRNQRGPWHELPKDRWPSRQVPPDRGRHDRGGGGGSWGR
jgi:hypothetical protein